MLVSKLALQYCRCYYSEAAIIGPSSTSPRRGALRRVVFILGHGIPYRAWVAAATKVMAAEVGNIYRHLSATVDLSGRIARTSDEQVSDEQLKCESALSLNGALPTLQKCTLQVVFLPLLFAYLIFSTFLFMFRFCASD